MSYINDVEIKIRGYHLDMFGHVNNARYLEFFEEGRWSYMDEFSEIYMIMNQEKIDPIVVRNEIDYRASAQFGDVIQIRTHLEKMGEKSAVFKQVISNKRTDQLMVEAQVTFVLKDKQTGKAVVIPEEFRKFAI